ncbi:hypothetical protein MTR67_051432 [Solanum verrucosum]|uniref:Uncharacterized protein n=1 Tax=Solanum verrucosum TaxID=315347 RepID=A0AAF0V4V8_SOLVR|nr:hypothetical protein MTR67_051432 [Solanum verrucosum]
MHPSRTSIRYI